MPLTNIFDWGACLGLECYLLRTPRLFFLNLCNLKGPLHPALDGEELKPFQ
jgi:hypothetical protein